MILYLDCSAGVSGDMLVAALLAAGAGAAGAPDADPLDRATALLDDVVRPALADVGIAPTAVGVRRVLRGGLDALQFSVVDGPGFATFAELDKAVRASALASDVAGDVSAVAHRMAEAERRVHGEDEPHLHELAAVDTAVDLISTAALVRHFAPEQVVAAPPALGEGEIETAHGTLAVPAPAVLALLEGLPTAGGGRSGGGGAVGSSGSGSTEPPGELTTPTGAALLAHFTTAFGGLPAGRVTAVGYGAGQRETAGRANLLRAVFLDAFEAGQTVAEVGAHDAAVLMETNIDDCSAELLAHAADELRTAGALDVWLTAAVMKKGRPGVVMHVLAAAGDENRLADVVFAETSTFGLRVVPVGRIYLDERRESVDVGGETVAVRLGFLHGRLVTASPEFEDCRRAAAATGRPAKTIYEAAQAAARALHDT